MGLPFQRQPIGNILQAHELSHKQVARAIDAKTIGRVNNLIMGRVYPTAVEIDALEKLVGLPIQTMFEPEVLKYFNPNGSRFSRARRAEHQSEVDLDRARAALDDVRRALDGSSER